MSQEKYIGMDVHQATISVAVSRREHVDTSGPMGRLFLTLIGSIAELESDLIRDLLPWCSYPRIR